MLRQLQNESGYSRVRRGHWNLMARKGEIGAGEMTYWVKTIAAKSNNLSLIPRNVMVERENQLCQVILQPPHTCHGICPSPE